MTIQRADGSDEWVGSAGCRSGRGKGEMEVRRGGTGRVVSSETPCFDAAWHFDSHPELSSHQLCGDSGPLTAHHLARIWTDKAHTHTHSLSHTLTNGRELPRSRDVELANKHTHTQRDKRTLVDTLMWGDTHTSFPYSGPWRWKG